MRIVKIAEDHFAFGYHTLLLLAEVGHTLAFDPDVVGKSVMMDEAVVSPSDLETDGTNILIPSLNLTVALTCEQSVHMQLVSAVRDCVQTQTYVVSHQLKPQNPQRSDAPSLAHCRVFH